MCTSGDGPICNAVSNTAATPEPLSLMPGPSGTLSRCAPAITTSAVEPVFVCAMTLRAETSRTLALSFTVTGPVWPRSVAPSAFATLTTGILTSVFSPRVPPISFSSTLSATTSAAAPRIAATVILSVNGHFPRSTSTTAPETGRPS